MGIGASIFLIALGAILTFALDFTVGGVNIDVVGWILMVAGVLGLLFTLLIWGPRRRAATTVTREPAGYEQVTREPADYEQVNSDYPPTERDLSRTEADYHSRTVRPAGYRRTEEHTDL